MSNLVVEGESGGQPASLSLSDMTLKWRARLPRPGPTMMENVVTTVHEVKAVQWTEQRHTLAAVAIALLGAVFLVTGELWQAIVSVSVAIVLSALRYRFPRRVLALDLGTRAFVLEVARPSAAAARALAAYVEHTLASGELPDRPPTLP